MAEHFELIVFGLLVAVAGLLLLSDVLEVPYPIFLVLGGLVPGFILGVPEVELAPELVLLIFLPTLLRGRDLVLFLTFCVIFVTLVGQGLTLQPLIRWLGLHDGAPEKEEIKA